MWKRKFIGKFKAVLYKYEVFQGIIEKELSNRYEINRIHLSTTSTYFQYLLGVRYHYLCISFVTILDQDFPDTWKGIQIIFFLTYMLQR